MLHSSDKFKQYICNSCGFLADPPAPIGTLTVQHKLAFCQHCKSNDNIFPVEIPYAAKLLTQELMALHVAPKYELQ